MRFRVVAGHFKVCARLHVFPEAPAVNVVATEEVGSLSSTCGCVPEEVRVAGFGQFRDRVTYLLGRDFAEPGGHQWRAGEASPWPVRVSSQ